MDTNPMHDLENLETTTIEIKNHRYNPDSVSVKEGSVIKIVNGDEEDHTITAENGEFDAEVGGGEQNELYPPAKGTYSFYCRYHENMKGTLIVE